MNCGYWLQYVARQAYCACSIDAFVQHLCLHFKALGVSVLSVMHLNLSHLSLKS